MMYRTKDYSGTSRILMMDTEGDASLVVIATNGCKDFREGRKCLSLTPTQAGRVVRESVYKIEQPDKKNPVLELGDSGWLKKPDKLDYTVPPAKGDVLWLADLRAGEHLLSPPLSEVEEISCIRPWDLPRKKKKKKGKKKS